MSGVLFDLFQISRLEFNAIWYYFSLVPSIHLLNNVPLSQSFDLLKISTQSLGRVVSQVQLCNMATVPLCQI